MSERQLDSVMDDVYELNPDTPKIKTDRGSCCVVPRADDAERILVETSGDAQPGALAWELRRLIGGGVRMRLDAIICVIDALNFPVLPSLLLPVKVSVPLSGDGRIVRGCN